MTLVTCLGRQMGAHPPAADEARRSLARKRLRRLWKDALAAPSRARVVLIHRSIRATYLISRPQPLPDVLVGCVWPNEPSGSKRKICGGIDSDFLTGGEGGARLAIARLGRVPSWPPTGHEASKGASLGGGATPVLGS